MSVVLIVVVSVRTRVIEVQVVGVVAIVGSRRPVVAVAAHIVRRTAVVVPALNLSHARSLTNRYESVLY